MIEYMRQAPLENEYDCEGCGVWVYAGDCNVYNEKSYCEKCYIDTMDDDIPSGKFCILPDGYGCPYVEHISKKEYTCDKYFVSLVFCLDEYAPKRRYICQAQN